MPSRWILVVLALAACGSVNDDAPIDAANTIDAPTTCEGSAIEACGASCEMCPASDREVATCDGTACGVTCVEAAPSCSDASCSRLVWAFDSGMLDGITPRDPPGLALRVGDHLGSQALGVDVTTLTEISFRVPICNTGIIDFSQRRLTYDVFFDGGDPQGQQYYVQNSLPSPMAGAFLGQAGVQAGVTVPISAQLDGSTFSGQATEFTVQAGTLGAPFAGTIWFDNFRIQ